jgi:hypothetical protein
MISLTVMPRVEVLPKKVELVWHHLDLIELRELTHIGLHFLVG